MICTECRAAGLKSTVSPGTPRTTLMHCPMFWDETGRAHRHNSNFTTQDFRCSNGHTWTKRFYPAKCWCGWTSGAEVPS